MACPLPKRVSEYGFGKGKNMQLRNSIALGFLVSLLMGTTLVHAATLEWEASTDSDLAGYRVFVGRASGVYTETIDVGNVLQYPLSTLEPGASYYLAVTAYDHWGNQSDYSPEVSYTPEISTGVEEELTGLPREFALYQNYPNPFNPETTIRYTVKEAGVYQLAVFNLRGQCIRVLLDDEAPVQGRQGEVEWDGKDASGQPVASGVYFYRLRQGNQIKTKQMALTR